MTGNDLLTLIRRYRLAVQSSVPPTGEPHAAVVGIGVTEDFEAVFESEDATRKVRNLKLKPKTAFVIGGFLAADEQTVQYEGVADEPKGESLEWLKEIYCLVHPDGRTRLSGPAWSLSEHGRLGFVSATSGRTHRSCARSTRGGFERTLDAGVHDAGGSSVRRLTRAAYPPRCPSRARR